MSRPTHLDDAGHARMVDVGAKAPTQRSATAEALVRMAPEQLAAALDPAGGKGDVLAVTRIAAIQGAKRTAELIPLCHPLGLDSVTVELEPDRAEGTVRIRATCRVTARTGVEMEAMTAVSVGALTLYDMVKGMGKGVTIEGVRLLHKAGGRSGEWRAEGA
jgi:cyclic pyranopterin phosphate synthase